MRRGIDEAWRTFGPSLVDRGYDPDISACEEAQARETFDEVRYQSGYVGLHEGHPFVERRHVDAGRWPSTNIWGRITAGELARAAWDVGLGARSPELGDVAAKARELGVGL